MRKNPKLIDEIYAKRDEKEAKYKAIGHVVDTLIEEDAFLDSCEKVVESVQAGYEMEVNKDDARKVMLAKGMKYRKINHVPISANTDRNLVLRQRWAMTVIDRDYKDKVYLNIDETWLGMSDFRRIKWQAPGTTNSVPALQMAPRVTMIVGVDTLGNVYLSLSQSNSN